MVSRRSTGGRTSAGGDEQIIAYMYANVSGTRPVSSKGPAFLVLGSFASVGELVGHINRVYGRKGPQCTILQTSKNVFVPLLSPKTHMNGEYPVQRASIHTKALISLYEIRRRREKKEFDRARAEQRPGTVDKNGRNVRKRLERLQEMGLDTIPETKEDSSPDPVQSSSPTTQASTSGGTDSESNGDGGSTQEGESNAESDDQKSAESTPSSDSATSMTVKTKSTIAPLDPRVKLLNQNYAVVSIIHDERKDRKNDSSLPFEPIVSFLDTFSTQKEAEEFARKAHSSEVPGAPLFVVQMYSWLFTEDISFESVPVAYPEQPMLERVINNHQRVQEQGEAEFSQGIDHARGDQKVPSSIETSGAPRGDEKRPPQSSSEAVDQRSAVDEKVHSGPPRGAGEGEEEKDIARAVERDDVLGILHSRVLKKKPVS